MGFPVLGAGLGGLALLLLPLLTLRRACRAGRALAGAGRRPGGCSSCVAVGIGARLAAAGRGARGRQPDRDPRRRAGPPLDRGPPGHQGPGPVHGRTAGGGLGASARGRRPASPAGARPARGPAAAAARRRWRAALAVRGGRAGGPRPAARRRRRGRETTGPASPAALAAAEALGRRRPPASCITGAEEFGLVGARVFVAERGDRLAGVEWSTSTRSTRRASSSW